MGYRGCFWAGKDLGLGPSTHLLTRPIPDPPVYLVCDTALCALKQPRDFCCVCVEAKEVPVLLVVKILWAELGLECCERQSSLASGPLGKGGLGGHEDGLEAGCPGACPRLTPITLCPQGHLSIVAAQSVYDTSMPRPSREMVRGEILPSAWVLQPITMEGKEITRVIYLAQVILPVRLAVQNALV